MRVQRIESVQGPALFQALLSRLPLLADLFSPPQYVAWGQWATYRLIVLPPTPHCHGVCVRAILPDVTGWFQPTPLP